MKVGNVERDDLDGSALCAGGLADDEVAYPDILLRRSGGSSDGNCEESSDGSEGAHFDVVVKVVDDLDSEKCGCVIVPEMDDGR